MDMILYSFNKWFHILYHFSNEYKIISIKWIWFCILLRNYIKVDTHLDVHKKYSVCEQLLCPCHPHCHVELNQNINHAITILNTMKYGNIAAILSTSQYTHNYILQAAHILHLQMIRYWLEQIVQSCKRHSNLSKPWLWIHKFQHNKTECVIKIEYTLQPSEYANIHQIPLWHSNFIQNTHNRCPISHPFGWAMGHLLWVQSVIYVLHRHTQYSVT